MFVLLLKTQQKYFYNLLQCSSFQYNFGMKVCFVYLRVRHIGSKNSSWSAKGQGEGEAGVGVGVG